MLNADSDIGAQRGHLDRNWIEQRLPHRGRMCLLDEVQDWDAVSIHCRSSSHRAPDHPLRAHGRLGAVCGVEYAAQAMAVHGALLAGVAADPGTASVDGTQHAASVQRPGLLASVRGLLLAIERLDEIQSVLSVHCERLDSDAYTAVYHFTVHGDTRLLLSGRAAVVFAGARFNS